MSEPQTSAVKAKAASVLATLVSADPDYEGFARSVVDLGDQGLPEAEQTELIQELMTALRATPQYASQIDTLLDAEPVERFDAITLSIPALVVIMFLLRSHISFTCRADGKWEFSIEHKPGDSKLLTPLLNKLCALLPGPPAE